MSPQVEVNGREEEDCQEDGVLLHHNCDSLCPLRIHILLPHILVDHGRSRLLCKVGFSWSKKKLDMAETLPQVLPVLEKEESAVHPKTE